MKVDAIRTRKMRPPQDDLWEVLEAALPQITERSVVVVTSKVVAIHQGRCIPIVESGVERDELAHREADWYAPRDIVPGQHILFTMKHQTMIASAGIDKSNAEGHMVLWPEEPDRAAREIQGWLKKRFGVKEVGVIITDSHVVMMRRGTMGISIGHFGFNPVRDYRGAPDIFGRELQVQVASVVDALAAAGVYVMGEGEEQTPVAVITDLPRVEFSEVEKVNRGSPTLRIPLEEDLFEPMLSAVEWKKGKGGLTNRQLDQIKRTGRLE